MLDNQCPGCGGQLDETTDPAHEDDWHAHDPVRCFRCDARMTKQEKYTEVNKHTGKPLVPRIEALLWEVTRA